ncbi:peptidylglycine alpha-hydroxylating monooxygenase [Zerene cesonia]|uniref:peptidylglycine alpha-hydroxylating monooxygenase n=1 Tax=Zerene cesonia TaxID=33412 RepID=UPI0018E52BC0|nr:peptidylglycine alpha-hydroxylating monooxygenase [Zerene cesonia]
MESLNIMFKVLIFIVSLNIRVVFSYEVDTYDFLMPNVYPHRDELYLCTPIRISPTQNFYIVGFKPNATMHTAHHMLLYGCSEPGSNDSVWSCGEMQSSKVDSMYATSSPCSNGSQIVYAWARDAPSLELPPDVGFLIGRDSPIKYLVLQVHYMSKFPAGKTDNSGVFLKYTQAVMPRQAAVLLLGTSGVIAPHKVEHMETACTLREDKVIHPFAFRTHTHSLGQQVSGYVVRKSMSGDDWSLIGTKDPQKPQMFYPVVYNSPIGKGDILAARCIMKNDHDYMVKIGSTNQDEMCNFYLMYWVENDTPLDMKYCFSIGPPFYYWNTAPEEFNRIPDIDDNSV